MKYDHILEYSYGKNVLEGGVEIYFMQPSIDYALCMDSKEFSDLCHYKYVLRNPFNGEKMYSRRFKEFKEARVEGIYELDNLWDMVDRGVKEDDEEFVEFVKRVKRLHP